MDDVALSARGIGVVTHAGDEPLDDDAFQVGLSGGRSEFLGDPPDRREWKFGGTEATSADVLVIVASDSATHLRTVVRELRAGIKAAKQKLLFVQEGHVLDGDLKGHEHFGFRDGVSQPGVRGLGQPKPGQPMIWPGQFVLGLPRQDDADPEHPLDPLPCPDWAKNGSFVVLRRLRQMWRVLAHDEERGDAHRCRERSFQDSITRVWRRCWSAVGRRARRSCSRRARMPRRWPARTTSRSATATAFRRAARSPRTFAR